MTTTVSRNTAHPFDRWWANAQQDPGAFPAVDAAARMILQAFIADGGVAPITISRDSWDALRIWGKTVQGWFDHGPATPLLVAP